MSVPGKYSIPSESWNSSSRSSGQKEYDGCRREGQDMYYPEEIIEEVREKNNIVDVISEHVRLEKKGANYFGLCPFHNEKSPSFSVSAGKQIYHCFGCGAGGNVISFVMAYENYSFPEAVRMLAERAGIRLPEADYSEEIKKQEGERGRLLEIQKEAARFFYYMLRSAPGETGSRYLTGRGLSEEIMKRFGLGFAPASGRSLVQYLKGKGYRDEVVKAAGLAAFDERHGMHDKFWNRVIFPIQDINHRVIGFGGRVMGDARPKYLNSPETLIFDKSRNLYGLNFARTARKGNIILCEGYMDVIALHQAGFTQAVASLGTAFTEGQANILKRYTREVLLAYDSDGAGVKAALRAIEILREAGITCRVVNMQPFKDPDELIAGEGTEGFQKRLDEAEGSFFFEIRMLQQGVDLKDPEAKTMFCRGIAEKLCGFSEEVERENYLEAVAERYHIGAESLRKLTISYAARTGGAAPARRPRQAVSSGGKTPEENSKRTQRLLITWLTDDPELYPVIAPYLSPEDFTDALYRKVAARLFADLEQGSFQPAAIVSMFADEEEQRTVAALFNTKLEQELETEQEREKALHEMIFAIKTESLNHYSDRMGEDADALVRMIAAKKALEEFGKTHISLKDR